METSVDYKPDENGSQDEESRRDTIGKYRMLPNRDGSSASLSQEVDFRAGKDRFVRRVYFSLSKEQIATFHERVAELQNYFGVSHAETARLIFVAGLMALETECRIADPAMQAVYRELAEFSRQHARDDQLEKLRQKMGNSDFAEFCQENAIDPQSIQHSRQSDDMSTSRRMEDWLMLIMRDGKPHATKDLRVSAERAGIIEVDADWAQLRALASRVELTTGRKGMWQLRVPD